jgi:hypothetical protein
MLSLVVFGASVYLGLYFNIAILLPFSLAAGALFLLSGPAAQGFIDNVKLLMPPLILVQAGYMVGLTAREFYGQLRVRLNIGQTKRI